MPVAKPGWAGHVPLSTGRRMASVFLSYAHADARSATPVAVALEKAGHSVWWDRHLRGGNQFSKEIEQALDAADVVVVLWSATSVESAWVRDEATAGRDSGRLIPRRSMAPIRRSAFVSIRRSIYRDVLAADDRQSWRR